MNTVSTTCPYCGVGCGVNVTLENQTVTVLGDKTHPANFGRLCSKGSALGQTIDLNERLLNPQINGQEVSWDQALDAVANGFAETIKQHGADSVAFYVSGQLLTEDYYVANKLIKGYLGTANIDTNSRLCMSSSVAGHKRAFGSDTVPCSYEDLEQAKLIVLVGSNAAWCHPVLFQRINAARQEKNIKVVVIDPRRTSSCDIADLHLPLKSGSDATLFNGLLHFLWQQDLLNNAFVQSYTEGLDEALNKAAESSADLAQVAQACGLPEQDIRAFYQLFADTERVVTVYSQGINQSSSGTDKVNAIINCHLLTGRIGRVGMGPFSFTGQPNAMGGREVGGLANMLAAHMDIDNADHRTLVQDFWQSPILANKVGLKAVDMFDAVAQGKIKAIWIMATNPVVSMPDADAVRAALKNCPLVVVSEVMAETDTSALAHIKLPALAWGEKSGTVTNSERRISRQRAFLPAPDNAKSDWWIIAQVAQKMGFAGFDYANAADVFREHAALSGYQNQGQRDFDIAELQQISNEEYDQLSPVQWPIKQGKGTSRMFSDGVFFTPNRKARFIPIVPRSPQNSPDSDFPLILNTGRVRDQWHTMTRTGKAPRLGEHTPEPYLDIHPLDAKEYGLLDGGLARVFSRWGEVIVRVNCNRGQMRGDVFIPMHWNDQFASYARVDALVNPVVDPISGQPELKHTPVRVSPYQASWHGFLLSRRKLPLTGVTYWARATGDGYYRYELASDSLSEDWPAWARQLLCAQDQDVNWVEYHDPKRQQYRGVRMIGEKIESCIFIAPSQLLPSRSWLSGLFNKDTLDNTERKGLLLGKAPAGQQDIGKIVCACFSVGVNTLQQAIKDQNLTSVEAIGKALKAGTNCGSCVPELRKLLG